MFIQRNLAILKFPSIISQRRSHVYRTASKFEEDQFEIKFENSNQRKFLIPTAEVVLTNLVRESIINEDHLPLRFVSSTPCFRKEAEVTEKTKGMMRQHQFYKVELVSVVGLKIATLT